MSLRRRLAHKKIRWSRVAILVIALLSLGSLFLFPRSAPLDEPLVDSDQFNNPPPILPSVTASSSSALHIPIFMYHYIEHVKDPGDTIRKSLDIFPETLDKQLNTLTQAGFTFLTMSEVGRIIDGQAKLPAKPIVLTFDDGYRDFFTDAFPVLSKYQAKSTAYIISGFIGRRNYMTADQLKIITQSGIVEIGAHTIHHIDLQHSAPTKDSEEILGSRTALEQLLGINITAFAYPGGRFNPGAVEMVKNSGFTTGVSTMPGTEVMSNNRFILFRVRPGSRTGDRLLEFIDHIDQLVPKTFKSQPE